MKKLLKELFYIPKYGKVQEKALLTRIALSVTLIVFCMAAMSITAYAYFTCSITANISPIQSAVWCVTVEAEPDVTAENEVYALDNTAGTEERVYQFTLKKAENATASHGYVKIDIKTDVDGFASVQTYYSQPMGRFLQDGTMIDDLDRVIKITVPAGNAAYVSFIAEWGTCAKEPVVEEILPLFAEVIPETEPETTEPETTEEVTEPETTEEMTEPETMEAPTEPETTEEMSKPETTEVSTEPDITEETTEPETTETLTEPETTEETTEPETTEVPTEPDTTEETTEPETTEVLTEPDTTEETTEPEITEAPTEPETTEETTEPETTEAVIEPAAETAEPDTTEPKTEEPTE